jgi:dTMP kinase
MLMFISFEGLDGCGKTTQVELLEAFLETRDFEVVATREPGGTELGETLREIVLHGGKISPWAEVAIFAAARAELVEEVIEPALRRGAIVISDRFVDSSLVYQGVARGLGIENVLQLNLHATKGLLPERTFLLLVDEKLSEARVGEERDRMERESEEFRRQVGDGYRRLAEMFPERIVALDGTQPREQIARQVRKALEEAGLL